MTFRKPSQMTKLLILSGMVAFPVLLWSQTPEITQSVSPIAGTSVELIQYDSFELSDDYKKSGPNQFWNFDQVEGLSDTTRLGYLNASETPYADRFPEATLAMTLDKNGYDYFIFDNKGYRQLGSFDVDEQLGISKWDRQFDKNYLIQFPIHYPSTFEDTLVSEWEWENLLLFHTEDQRNIQVDGYGTLVFGKDSFFNAVRVRTISNITRKVIPIHPEAKSGTIWITDTTYRWWVDGVKVPVLSISRAELSDTKNPQPIFKQSMTLGRELEQYLSNRAYFPLNLKAYTGKDKNLKIWFELQEAESVQIMVTDISGKRAIPMTQNQFAKGQNQFDLSLANVSAGIYFLTVQTSQNKETIKVFLGE